MTVNFTSLSNCITQNDHYGFLISYMKLVIAGKQLTVPTSLEYFPVKEAWEEILFGVPGGYTQEFLINLTNLWIQVVKKQGAYVDEHFMRDIVDLLENRQLSSERIKEIEEAKREEAAGESTSQSSKDLASSQYSSERPPIAYKTVKEVSEVQRQTERDPKLDHVAGSISKKYFKEKKIKEYKLPPQDQLNDEAKQFFNNSKQIDQFLIAYLGRESSKIYPVIPKSSVLDIIHHRWREILMDEYNKVPSDDFLKGVSARWFSLVNQEGLPQGRDQLKKMIYMLMMASEDGVTDEIAESVNKIRKKEEKKKSKGVMGLLTDLFT